MNLAKRIAAWRRAKNFSQRKLASRVGVSPSAASLWEKGTPPHHDNLCAIAEAFDITLEEFYGPVPKAS